MLNSVNCSGQKMNVQVLVETHLFLFTLNLSCLFQSCVILQTTKAQDLHTCQSLRSKLETFKWTQIWATWRPVERMSDWERTPRNRSSDQISCCYSRKKSKSLCCPHHALVLWLEASGQSPDLAVQSRGTRFSSLLRLYYGLAQHCLIHSFIHSFRLNSETKL